MGDFSGGCPEEALKCKTEPARADVGAEAGQSLRVSVVFGSCFSDQAAVAGALRGDARLFWAQAAMLLIKDAGYGRSGDDGEGRLLIK